MRFLGLPSPAALTLLLALGSSGGLGCIHKGFFTDGTSVSLGRADRGILRAGKALPTAGAGYLMPPLWIDRGNHFGTEELVGIIERAASRVDQELPGSLLGIGDLSRRGGGRMQFHRSHENGRDADLIFYAVDDSGIPVPPANAMPRYNRHLQSRPPREPTHEPITPRLFDVPRNWALISALVDDPEVQVEYLFISERLKEKLIDYARSIGAADTLIDKARRALRQPGRHALPHDDHLHLRIKCPQSDTYLGCVDEGRVRLRYEVVRPRLAMR